MIFPFLFPDPGETLFLGLLALFVDALFGGHNLLGRLPGPDSLLRVVGLYIQEGVAALGLGHVWRWIAGTTLILLLVFLAAIAGRQLDLLATSSLWLVMAKAGFLALLLGQRSVIDTARELAGRLASPSGQEAEGRYAAARWMVERMTNRFSDGLIANLLWFTVGGFTGLLAFRAVAVLAAVGSPNGVRRPLEPLFHLAGWLYWLAGLLPGLITASVLLIAAAVVVPSRAFQGAGFVWSANLFSALPARLWPLHVICKSLDLSLKADPDGEAPGREWIGSRDARARAGAPDVRRTMLTIISGWLIVFAMLSGLLLQVLG